MKYKSQKNNFYSVKLNFILLFSNDFFRKELFFGEIDSKLVYSTQASFFMMIRTLIQRKNLWPVSLRQSKCFLPFLFERNPVRVQVPGCFWLLFEWWLESTIGKKTKAFFIPNSVFCYWVVEWYKNTKNCEKNRKSKEDN